MTPGAESKRLRLRIAITADPEVPVPPTHYGGIERVVHMLVEGLVSRGHHVTLFAHRGSRVPCILEAYREADRRSVDLLRNTWQISSTIARGSYDIVHSFGRLAYLFGVLPLSIPKVMSYQRAITRRSVAWANRLARGTLHFTTCSRSLMGPYARCPNWHVIFNGVPLACYSPSVAVPHDAPLVFVGRIEPIKGPHLAIDVARRSGRSLVLAGNVPEGPIHRAFFEREILPWVDGCQIRYLGPVTDEQKAVLLSGGAALLMPVLWEEPFGIVMIEALACGTPVIGLRRGAVSEVVEHAATGFVCDSVDEMVDAVRYIDKVDRRRCRAVAERCFGEIPIVDAYEQLYASLIARARQPPSGVAIGAGAPRT